MLAVDSAVTVQDRAGAIVKVYEGAEKLFGLGERPIGVAVYGLGNIGPRSVGSYLNEYVTHDPGGALDRREDSLGDIVEHLRVFLLDAYLREIAPVLEQQIGMPYDQIPPERRPVLGVVVVGFRPRPVPVRGVGDRYPAP